MDIITNRLVRQAVPLFNVFAGLGVVLSLATLLMFGKDVFIPIALALLLSFALTPVASWLQRIGLGRGPAVLLAVSLAVAVIVALGYIVFSQLADLAAQLPAYKEIIRQKIQTLMTGVAGGGPFSRAGAVVGELITDFQKMAGAAASQDAVVVVRPEEASGVKLAGETLAHLLHPLAMFAAVFLITAFTLAQREDLRNRVLRLLGADDLQQTTAALDDAGGRLGKLLLTQLAINAAFGVVIGLGLWWIGVPSPFLWGILAGVFRFVPYIGAVIGLAPPLAVAFAFDPTWTSFLWTAALFAVIEPIVGHVIEPLLYGHSTGLSPLAVVLSATIWAFLWGPVGLVLSTPLTICFVVLGRHIERLQFLDVLLGDRPALEPHEIFYQRMLAGDPREATLQAQNFLQGRSLATYYDEVALNAIRRAHLDIVRGSVSGDRLTAVARSANTLVASLENAKSSLRSRRSVSAEAEAAFARIQDSASTRDFVDRAALEPAWRGRQPAVILYGDHPLDEAPARMLAQVIGRFGLPTRVAKMSEAANATADDLDGVRLVFLSFVEPLSTLHLRAAGLQVRKRLPDARIALCIWQQTDKSLLDKLSRHLRVDGIATTTSQALDVARRLAKKQG